MIGWWVAFGSHTSKGEPLSCGPEDAAVNGPSFLKTTYWMQEVPRPCVSASILNLSLMHILTVHQHGFFFFCCFCFYDYFISFIFIFRFRFNTGGLSR